MEDLGTAFQWNLAARAASKRSNCKGPPGLPCAVTPQGTWPPCVPSKQSTIISILRRSVCPVVYSYKGRKRTSGRMFLPGSCAAVLRSTRAQSRTKSIYPRWMSVLISFTRSLSPTSAHCCPCANNPSTVCFNTRTNVPCEVTSVTMPTRQAGNESELSRPKGPLRTSIRL
jgi:hypothetical protein